MDEVLLREIASEYLLPFFSGARLLDESQPSTPREQLVSWRTPLEIAFKVEKSDNYRLILYRQQPFAKSKDTIVPEVTVVKSFVNALSPIAAHLQSCLKHDLLSTFQRRVVALALRGSQRERILLEGIDQLSRWGTRLYEGAPVSAAIGFRAKPQEDNITLTEIGSEDFGYVMSNGYDTLLELDFDGRLIRHQSLLPNDKTMSHAPLHQGAVAEWTTEPETRVAMTLNRLGEILIFRKQQLLFARRSGRWHFLTHDPVIKQMSPPKNLKVRRAVYETCLDASFARTGACIGVVTHSNQGALDFVSQDDLLLGGDSLKARTMRKLVGGRLFQKLDRRLRQELVAVDGATVLSHQGDVLAVGAILRIPGGSTGGGRLAAARQLSKVGLGIKVSQDGGIQGFRQGADSPSFWIM